MENKTELWSIGHSTHAIDEFIGALQSFEIKVIADVRSFPVSRRYPQFNKENLEASLAKAEIEYLHFPELGGRRRVRPDSHNMAWRNKMFRGYADYMETDGFGESIRTEIAFIRQKNIMDSRSIDGRPTHYNPALRAL